MDIAYLRSISKQVGIIEIKEVKEEIILQFDTSERINGALVKALVSKYNRSIIFKLGTKPAFAYKYKNSNKEEILASLIEIVKYIKGIL
jgi:transcription-repair coupling factor (superfamily II helicase)